MSAPASPAALPQKIAIVGAGAVGCYYGGRLAQHGNEVHFLMRSDYSAVKAHGLQIHSPLGDVHLQPVHCHQTTAEIGPCDLVIIAIKSTANLALLDLLPPLLNENTRLLTLQNGLGNEEFLAQHFSAQPISGGLCFVCINRTAPGIIQHIAQGQIILGDHQQLASADSHALAAEMKRCGIPCHVDDSLMRARWKKLVWNVPFNGLSIVAGGIDTAAILDSAPLTARVHALMLEVITAANSLGHPIPLSLADDMIARTRTMTPYKPSSLIDFLDGKEVELESIWGQALRQATAAGVPMPELQRLHTELSASIAHRTPKHP
ncbi:MAG: 2-dehydropantoate 2-reductase [Verrucomicrobiales bacterium]|nr:2-dehydropantoate 2-reductase [Verrucomicrobiales bacterium]MCP5556913.1 2-dehydropantoate 2-reductase [Verrucomicrobiaceae bacterium]